VTAPGSRGAIAIDTDVFSADLVPTSRLAERYAPISAQLRADCVRIGHALAQREHNADRWIAATAIRLGIPLVSNDTIFKAVPGLTLESLA
jgi:predicted nucleic acid-binding protein